MIQPGQDLIRPTGFPVIQEQLLNIHNAFIQIQKVVELKSEIVIKIGIWDIVASYNQHLGKALNFCTFICRFRSRNSFLIAEFRFRRPKPYGSHGLCPIFYNIAFKHKFMAIDKSRTCSAAPNVRDLTILPSDGIRMGYFQKLYNSTLLNGINLYAITKKDPPYC